MKKQFIIFMSIGLILLTIGAVGAASLFKSIETTSKADTHETYQPKNKEALETVNLTVNGETEFTIIPSDDEQFHLDNTHYNINEEHHLTWKTKEDKNSTNITVENTVTQKNNLSFSFFDLDLWSEWSPTIIQVPKGIKTLNITSQQNDHLDVSSLVVESLVLDTPFHTTLSNIEATTLASKKKDGSINLSSSNIKGNINLSSNQSDISILSTTAKQFNITTTSGTIDLGDVTGAINVNNTNGTTFLNKIKGEAKVKHTSGTIDWKVSHKIYPATLSNESGELDIHFPDEKAKIELKTSAPTGNTFVDNELTDNYSVKNGKQLVDLTTDDGIINIYYNEGYYIN